jgi:mono/diheme cytochrome c family protein
VAPGSVEFFQRDPKALVRGNAIYLGSCANFCHEYSLPEGARLNLFDCSWVYGGTNAEIAGVIRKGLKDKRMPGFGDNFPEEHDLNKVVAYLRSKEGSCDAIL